MPHEATNEYEYEAVKPFSLTSKMDGDSTALEIDKSINVLNACEWIAAVVQNISAQTTQRCFRKDEFSLPDDAMPVIDDDNEDDFTVKM